MKIIMILIPICIFIVFAGDFVNLEGLLISAGQKSVKQSCINQILSFSTAKRVKSSEMCSFSRGHATLHLTVSVGRSIGR